MTGLIEKRNKIRKFLLEKETPFTITANRKDLLSPFPLTSIQLAYLYGRVNETDRCGCHFYHEFVIDHCDIARLERSLKASLRRHRSLTLAIRSDGQQQFKPELINQIRMDVVDLSDCDKEQQNARIQQLRDQLSAKVYEVDSAPYFTAVLTKLHGDTSLLHFSIDSWLLDGVSAQIFFHDWYCGYYNLPMSKPAEITYRDYVLGYERYRHTNSYRKDQPYWAKKIASIQPGPWGDFEEGVQYLQRLQHPRKRMEFVLSKETRQKLEKMASSASVSLSAAVLTLFSEFLGQHSSGLEFSLMVTASNRPRWHPALAGVVGTFTAVSVFNYHVTQSSSLFEQLKQTQKKLLEDLDHLKTHFLDVYSRISDSGKPNRLPPIVFTSLLGQPHPTLANNNWLQRLHYGVSQTPGVYLDHQLMFRNEELVFIWDAVTDIFSPNFLVDLFNQYTRFIESTVESLDIQEGYVPFQLWSNHSVLRAANKFKPFTPLQQIYLTLKARNPAQSTTVYQCYRVKGEAQFCESVKKNCVLLLQNTPILYLNKQPAEIDIDSVFSVESEYVSNLSKHVFTTEDTPFLKVVLVPDEVGYWQLHLAIDELVADGLSTLLVAHYLMNGLPDHYQPKLESLPHLSPKGYAEFYYSHRRCQSILNRQSKELRTRDDKNGRRVTQRINRKAVESVSKICRVDVDSVMVTALTESIGTVLRDYDSVIVSVLCARERYLHCSEVSIDDYSLLSYIEPFPSDDSFVAKAIKNQFIIYKDLMNSLSNYLAVSVKNNTPLPTSRYAYTSCLSDLLPPTLTELVSGISHTPNLAIDCFSYYYAGAIQCHFDYDASQYTEQQIRKLAQDLCDRINLLAENEQQVEKSLLIRELESDARLRRLVIDYNENDKAYNDRITLPQLLFKAASHYPNQTAILAHNKKTSYEELTQLIQKIQSSLSTYVAPGEAIAVCLPRDELMVASVFAVMRLGCCYVPLDSLQPLSRMQDLMNQAEVNAIITKQDYSDRLAQFKDQLIDLDQLLASPFEENRNDRSSAKDRAYIIFTSGSTGIPKGVVVRHQPVVNLIEWVQNTFQFNKSTVALSTSPFSFDLSVFDIFATLAVGGTVYLTTEEQRIDGTALAAILEEETVTFWNSAPAVLQQCVPFLNKKTPIHAMKLIFLSGDWIPIGLPDTLKRYFPKATVVSLGGATEATVWSNYHVIEQVDPSWKSIPYGRPIQNARYYVLDRSLMPCQPGNAGELYIGGECLSDGYLDPKLSAESFLVDPVLGPPHRVYRTGDLAKIHPDGLIELLGRVDNQIKIRGYRIEPGEVEAAFKAMGIEGCVVTALGDEAYSRKLVAYVEGQLRQSEDEILKLLSNRLPNYMLPAQIVKVEQFPLTANGKVDRKALEKIASQQTQETQETQEASPTANCSGCSDAELEKRIRYLKFVVSDLLKCASESIPEHKNIGLLGFNSLQYTLFAARISRDHRIRLSPTFFFRYNTIYHIATQLKDKLVLSGEKP